ncbi:hypothetical protein C6J21_001410 [Salmonella enterica subsp. enterica serovar Thompson]|nr:hypothetical protein [Salmonella enterica]EDR6374140.1 hypothetical protein [Salmonella enterica subsp. enterica serovar Thompson]EAT3714627.1 hypothetical protein [Salmonella enterica]EDU5430227.1 hypothetical protein [Salmonella enterica subsp. enterica serovar Thompson]EFR6439130.1 hypothetical protein [Salmonella enterica]
MINEPVVKLRRTPARQGQRDVFLMVARAVRAHINEIILNAEKDKWSDVEYLLQFMGDANNKLKDILPTDRAEPQGD